MLIKINLIVRGVEKKVVSVITKNRGDDSSVHFDVIETIRKSIELGQCGLKESSFFISERSGYALAP